MRKCLICSNISPNLICSRCGRNPFKVEKLRHLLAEQKKLEELRETYRGFYATVDNINSPVFWNQIFQTRGPEEIKSPITADRFKEVVKIVRDKKGKILDVGFGWGFLEKELSELNEHELSLYGIDISDIAILEARKKFSGEFIKGSVSEIPFDSDYFDIVVCLEVLEHILPSVTLKALNELRRVLRKEGLLIISVPLNENLQEMIAKGENPNGHVRVYTPQIIRIELEIAGFEVLREKYFYAFKNLYWLKNFLQKTFLRDRWQPNNILLVAQKP